MDYLVARGVAADRISVVGYGESQPRSTNDTIEGRRLNRRVEVRAIG
jgi:OOP family OmpA-OmpF porin